MTPVRRLPRFNASGIPAAAGVYFLYMGDECVYIGSSVNMRTRVQFHNKRGKFDRVETLRCTVWELDALEHKYLQIHRPRLNGKLCIYTRRRVWALHNEYRGHLDPSEETGWYWSLFHRRWRVAPLTHCAHLKAEGYCVASRKRKG